MHDRHLSECPACLGETMTSRGLPCPVCRGSGVAAFLPKLPRGVPQNDLATYVTKRRRYRNLPNRTSFNQESE